MEGSYQGFDGTWTGNMAGLAGGAQLAFNANVMLAGTMIAENTAGSTGGGLAYGNCTSILRGCTLSGNYSSWSAGGAYLGSGAVGDLGLRVLIESSRSRCWTGRDQHPA